MTGWLCCLALAACSALAPADPGGQAAAERVAVFLGDSYTAGYGAAPGRGYVAAAGRELGWTAVPAGQSGTGYLADGGRPGLSPYADRIAEVLAAQPDVVVVQGSTNDVGRPAGAVGAAAGALYARLAAALPDARIVVVGPVAPPGVDPIAVREVRNELEHASAAAGLPFVDPIAERWLRPPDGLFSDPVHPNDAGYARMAHLLAEDLQGLGL